MKPADIRREKLARYLAEGLSMPLAARKSGFTSSDYARKVSQEPEMQVRIRQIIEEGYDQTLRDSAALDAMLDEMLEADPRCFYDDDGHLLHPSELRNAESLTLTGIKPGQHGIELKFESKLSVLKLAMQRRGMLVERKEVVSTGGADIADGMSAHDAAELYRMML